MNHARLWLKIASDWPGAHREWVGCRATHPA